MQTSMSLRCGQVSVDLLEIYDISACTLSMMISNVNEDALEHLSTALRSLLRTARRRQRCGIPCYRSALWRPVEVGELLGGHLASFGWISSRLIDNSMSLSVAVKALEISDSATIALCAVSSTVLTYKLVAVTVVGLRRRMRRRDLPLTTMLFLSMLVGLHMLFGWVLKCVVLLRCTCTCIGFGLVPLGDTVAVVTKVHTKLARNTK